MSILQNVVDHNSGHGACPTLIIVHKEFDVDDLEVLEYPKYQASLEIRIYR